MLKGAWQFTPEPQKKVLTVEDSDGFSHVKANPQASRISDRQLADVKRKFGVKNVPDRELIQEVYALILEGKTNTQIAKKTTYSTRRIADIRATLSPTRNKSKK